MKTPEEIAGEITEVVGDESFFPACGLVEWLNERIAKAIRDERQHLSTIEPIADDYGKLERENNHLRTRVKALEEGLQNVAVVWGRQSGRVFESMGIDNPRAMALNEAIENAQSLLSRKGQDETV